MADKFDITAYCNLQFGPNFDKQLKKLNKSVNDAVKVDVKLNAASLKNVAKQIKGLKPKLDITLNVEKTTLDKLVKTISSKSVTIDIKPNLKLVYEKLKNLNLTAGIKLVPKIADLKKDAANIEVAVAAKFRKKELQDSLRGLVFDITGRVIADRTRLKEDLASIKGLKVYANVVPVFDKLKQKLDGFNRTVTVDVVGRVKTLSTQISNAKSGAYGGGGAALGSPGSNINSSSINRSATAVKSLQSNVNALTNDMELLGRQTANTVRRFGLFNIASTAFYSLTGAIKDGFKQAIEFEREMIKISQVTGLPIIGLQSLSNEVSNLSTNLGVSSQKLLTVSQTLAQAGLTAQDTKIALAALAKTELSPTFENLTNTGEAAIAVMAQFGYQSKDLEGILSSLNAVSGKFAVESSDLTTAIQRTGGAFQSAGGSVEELVSLFTSVRATTRESAEGIATGFRTIFTRLQRGRTFEFLNDLGINLRNAEGDFVGAYEAIRRLSGALNELNSQDPRYSQIIEELGGFRQISKVIPLIQKFSLAEQARTVYKTSGNSLEEDAIQAQKSLANQLTKVREEFLKLIRDINDSEGFKVLTKLAIDFSKALIDMASNLKDIALPLALLAGAGLRTPARDFFRGFTSREKVRGFANGGLNNDSGFIAGSGNKDKVNAKLMNGEYVIKKSAVQKLGVNRLHAINQGVVPAFAQGGMFGGEEAKKMFNKVPKELLDMIRELKVIISTNLKDVFPQLAGQDFGNNKKINNLRGVYVPSTNTIGLRHSAKDIDSTKYHELGHAFDQSTGVSNQDNFAKLIHKDLKALGIDLKKGLTEADIAKLPERMKYILSDLVKGKTGVAKDGRVTLSARDRKEVYADLFASNFSDGGKETASVFSGTSKAVTSHLQRQAANRAGINAGSYPGQNASSQSFVGPIQQSGTSYFSPSANNPYLQPPPPKGPGIFSRGYNATKNAVSSVSSLTSARTGGFLSNLGIKSQKGADKANSNIFSAYVFTQVVSSMTGLNDEVKQLINNVGAAAIQFNVFKGLLSEIGTSKLSKNLERQTAEQADLLSSFKGSSAKTQGSQDRVNAAKQSLASVRSERQQFINSVGGKAALSSLAPQDQLVYNDIQSRRRTAASGVVSSKNELATNQIETANIRRNMVAKRKEARATQRKIDRMNGAATLAAGGSALATAIGSSYSQRADLNLAQLREGSGSESAYKNNAALGGSLSTAGSFAAAGAATGAFFGPGGLVAGAGIGAAAGAYTGFIDSLKKAEIEIKRIKFNDQQNKNAVVFSDIANRKVDPRNVASKVNLSVADYNAQLQGESDGDLRKEIKAAMSANAVGLNEFVNGISNSVSSLDEFNTLVSNDVLQSLSYITKTPLSELQKNVEKNIETANKQRTVNEKLIKTLVDTDIKFKLLNNFSSAFDIATNAVVNFSDSLESGVTLSGGSFNFQDVLSPLLDSVLAGFGSRDFNKKIQSFTSQFGQAGDIIYKDSLNATKALDTLPDILYKLRSTAPFENTGDFTQSFEGMLRDSGIDSSISNLLTGKIQDIIGSDLRESNIYDKLNKNFSEVLKDVGSILEPVLKTSIDANNKSESFLQNYNDRSLQANSSGNKYRQDVGNKFYGLQSAQNSFNLDYQSSIPGSRGNFDNYFNTQNAIDTKRDINNNIGDPRTLGQNVRNSQANIASLEKQIQSTGDINQRKLLIDAMNKEKLALEKSVDGLNNLSDVSSRTALAMAVLNKEQDNRKSRFNSAKQLALASGSELSDIRRKDQLARAVSSAGSFEILSGEDKKSVADYIDSFSPDVARERFGATTDDIIARQLGNVSGVTVANKDEKDALNEVNKRTAQGQTALDELYRISQQNQENFNKTLESNFTTFISKLEELINKSLGKSIQDKAADVSSRRDKVANDLTVKNVLRSNFGASADPNKIIQNTGNAKSISEGLQSARAKQQDYASVLQKTSGYDTSYGFMSTMSDGDANKKLETMVRESIAGIKDKDLKNEIEQYVNKDFLPTNQIKSGIGTGGASFQLDEKFRAFQQNLLVKAKGQSSTVTNLTKQKDELATNLGVKSSDIDLIGSKGFEAFTKGVNATENSTAEMAKLTAELQILNQKFIDTQNPVRKASGGLVPGFGNLDSVPAKLMPGEYVVRKSAVQKVGLGTLQAINSGRKPFANGGLVSQDSGVSITGLSDFVNKFSIQIDKLGKFLGTIPSTIQMTGNHRVEVIINGAQVLQNIQPEISQLIQLEIGKSLNKMLYEKFPEVGPYNGNPTN